MLTTSELRQTGGRAPEYLRFNSRVIEIVQGNLAERLPGSLDKNPMCELYVKADPILYECRSRSMRIQGVVTTLRLENQFWDILQEIAEADGMTTNQLIAKLYKEVIELRGQVKNFASFLRVGCTRYLAQREARLVPLMVGQTMLKSPH